MTSLRTLAVGERSAVLRVEARRRWNATGIAIGSGQHHEVVARGRWLDSKIESDADGQPGRWPQTWFRRWIRCRDGQWFQLIGSVGGMQHALGMRAALHTAAGEHGELLLYANDLLVAYWNNCGAIDVRVTRVG